MKKAARTKAGGLPGQNSTEMKKSQPPGAGTMTGALSDCESEQVFRKAEQMHYCRLATDRSVHF
jgi:hypothetical protein